MEKILKNLEIELIPLFKNESNFILNAFLFLKLNIT
jgi:hypothetical protein